jgi:DNA polymerase-3 subunit epsilon
MKLELDRPLIVFDVETTGVDPKHDRIVELAALKIHPDGRREEKCKRFNPLIPIPVEASRVHGITDEAIANEPPFSKVAKSIASFFSGCDLGGFNIVRFDVPLLQAELERSNQKLNLSDISLVDAYQVFVQKEPRTLEAAIGFYCQKEHEDAHTALGDVKATVEVIEAQMDHYSDLPRTPREIDSSVRHPESVDRLGKLKWVDDSVTISFGRNRGQTLEYLVREEPDYIKWMIQNEVAPDVEGILQDALLGHFPKKPQNNPTSKAESSTHEP